MGGPGSGHGIKRPDHSKNSGYMTPGVPSKNKHLKSLFSNKLDPSCHAHKKERDRLAGLVEDPVEKLLRRQKIAMEYKDVQDVGRQNAADMLQVLIDIAKDADQPSTARAAAANAVLDRTYGKSATTVFNVNQNADVKPEDLSDDELRKRIDQNLKRLENTPEAAVGEERPADIRKYN